jgi:biopolymer transport protein TolR
MAKPTPVPPPPLSPAQRGKIRRLSAPAAPDAGEGGELNVVPYLDVVMNLTMFVLATVSVIFVSSVDTSAAVQNPDRPYQQELSALRLSVLITDQGVGLKTAGGNVAPGCEGLGRGITIPRAAGAHDLASVAACARRLKTARPEFAAERQVTLSASPGVDYQTVMAVMDTLRGDGAAELFPEVHLAVVR